jgi:hypothetical protein
MAASKDVTLASSSVGAVALSNALVVLAPASLGKAEVTHPLGSQVQLKAVALEHWSGSDAHSPWPTPVWHQPQPSTGVHVPQDEYRRQP